MEVICWIIVHNIIRKKVFRLHILIVGLYMNPPEHAIVFCIDEKRHRHQEYLRFLSKIDKETNEEVDLHLIVDNYCTHKHKEVRKWLDKHPRFHIHFIPTSSSWLNLVERFFGKITDDRIRRGIFKSVMQLVEAIHDYIKAYNTKPKPLIWTKTADQILDKVLNIKKSINTI